MKPLSLQGILFTSGTTEVLLATILPLQVAKVRMITSPSRYRSTLDTIQLICEEEGLGALFRGVSASLLTWIPSVVIPYLSLELFHWLMKREPVVLRENIGVGVVVQLAIGLLEYPILTAEAIRQSQLGEPDTVIKIVIRTAQQEGVHGLYRGFSCHVMKTWQRAVSSWISRKTKSLFLRVPIFRVKGS